MRILTVSDLHVDYAENLSWVMQLGNGSEPSEDFSEDVLILAGDVCDDLALLRDVLSFLTEKFGEVLFVPGNHELWVEQGGSTTGNGNAATGERFNCSLEKFHAVEAMCAETGVHTEPWHQDSLSIIPLYSWYDFSFGQPDTYLRRAWRDFRACRWPDQLQSPESVCNYFLQLNEPRLSVSNDIVISFSHFLPRLDVMPASIPKKRRKVYPVLGSDGLGSQLTSLNPDIHIYGHSHVNQCTTIDGICYVNNAFAYPSEERISRKALHCVYDSQQYTGTNPFHNQIA